MTKNMTQTKKQFGADVSKVLNLMIHSLYTDKEIFLRELISNASDACDKLRYLSQTDSKLLEGDAEFKISISLDKEKNTIIIRDNGIGMNDKDLDDNLGMIAKSGTQQFINQFSKEKNNTAQLIGQFGVGFYSAFMVAEKISVTSKKAGETKQFLWESDGQGEYTIAESDRDFARGTEITLFLKPTEKEFLDEARIKNIVKNYSDHISVPIMLMNEKNEEEQINASSAIWTQAKSEITEEKYKEFYKQISYAYDDPWVTLHNRNEGIVEFTNLLFIPKNKTFDLFHPDRKCRVKLYVKQVFIADDNIDILPKYLRFVRGIVDSQDLPLNISRQTLQNNAVMSKMKSAVTNKVLAELKKKKNNHSDEYLEFWNNFGAALKEGLCEMGQQDNDKLLEICIFKSALTDKMISFDDYIANSKNEDKTIYYISGDDSNKLKNNPQIEGFLKKNIDVLLLSDSVDDFWVNLHSTYNGYQIKSVTNSDIDISEPDNKAAQEENNKEYESLITYAKSVLGDLVKEVKISRKLDSTPACLTIDGAMSMRMERHLVEQKQLAAATARILELNPNHKIVKKIIEDLTHDKESNQNNDLIKLLYDQACIIEGEPIADASAFVGRFNTLLETAYNKI